MKVLFLDMDGVMNHTHMNDNVSPWPWTASRAAVGRLNRILLATGAKVVISSTWRKYFAPSWFAGFFTAHGLSRELIGEKERTFIDRTPFDGPDRGWQIQRWLDDNDEWEIESYCVIDDDSGGMERHDAQYIRTEYADGLLDCHVEEAIQILGRKAQP